MTLRPGHKAAFYKYGIVGGLFVTIFNGLMLAADQIHDLEPLAEAFERHLDLPQPIFDAALEGLLALATLTICLYVARTIEIWRLKRHAHWRQAESGRAGASHFFEAHANGLALRRNLRTLVAFAGVGWIPALLGLLKLQHSVTTVMHWSGPVASFAMRAWPTLVFMLIAWGCMVFANRIWVARLQDIDLPGGEDVDLGAFLDMSKLRFRPVTSDPNDDTHTEAQHDIRQLADTEKYGAMGETDLDQVFDWWLAYPRGNWLAEYDGRIVGGIDVWPLKKAVYLDLRSGRIGEEDIERKSLAPHTRAKSGSYWYVASISLSMGLERRTVRRAVLAKLIETMLEQNFLPSITSWPAHVIALIWTKQGANMARRSGFRYLGERKSDAHVASEPIYEIVFRDEAAVRDLIARIRTRRVAAEIDAAAHPPVENPG